MKELNSTNKDGALLILSGGEIKALDAKSDDKLEISGWMSTDGVDLSKEVVEAKSFEEYLGVYKQAGRMWHNHDSNQVIGKAHEMSLESNGLRLDKGILSATEFNKNYLMPLIRDGAVSEMSIQFKSMKGTYINRVYHHQKVYLIETSVVSVACNPEAVINNVKSLVPAEFWGRLRDTEKALTLDDLMELDKLGLLKMPKDVKQTFYMGEGIGDNNKLELPMSDNMNKKDVTEGYTPDFSDYKVISKVDIPHDEVGKILPLPQKVQKNYDELCAKIFLVKSDFRNSYMYRIASLTENGVKYDFDQVALSTAYVFGVRGGALFDKDQKTEIIKELISIYEKLGKTLPTYKGIPINEVEESECANSIKYSDLEFHNGENKIVYDTLVKTNTEAIKNYLDASENKLQSAREVAKYVYGSMDFRVSIYPSSAEDMAIGQMFLDCLSALYPSEPDDSADAYTYMSADLDKFVALSDKIIEMKKKIDEDREEKELLTKLFSELKN